jgi:hypothetical protein
MQKEYILIFGDAPTLKEVGLKYREPSTNVQLREFRAWRGDEFEQTDKVILAREHEAVRAMYESKGIPVELDLRKVPPAITREEIEDMPFFKKKTAIKDLTGQMPANGIEANYLLNLHFGPKS